MNIATMENNHDKGKIKTTTSIGGFFFIGCMFIGAGIEMKCEMLSVRGAIGMGVGFIAMGIVWIYYTKRK